MKSSPKVIFENYLRQSIRGILKESFEDRDVPQVYKDAWEWFIAELNNISWGTGKKALPSKEVKIYLFDNIDTPAMNLVVTNDVEHQRFVVTGKGKTISKNGEVIFDPQEALRYIQSRLDRSNMYARHMQIERNKMLQNPNYGMDDED